MLAYSPPLPLVIEYFHTDWNISAEEEGIILALKHGDHVHLVRILMPVPNLQKVIMAMDKEYPVLDYLILEPSTKDNSTALMLPETLQAPRLYHLLLIGFAIPTGSRLLTTAGVTAHGPRQIHSHCSAPTASYFPPNILLQCLSFMPQLDLLVIDISFPGINRDILMHTLIPTPIILPNLRIFVFRGDDTYMEAFIHLIGTPCLKSLVFLFIHQPTFSVPRFLQFMNIAGSLRFNHAKFKFFGERVYVAFYHCEARRPK